jgi:hypothetical protein
VKRSKVIFVPYQILKIGVNLFLDVKAGAFVDGCVRYWELS